MKCTKSSLNLPITLLKNKISLHINFEFFLKMTLGSRFVTFSGQKKTVDKSGLGDKLEDKLYIKIFMLKIPRSSKHSSLIREYEYSIFEWKQILK